MKKAFIILILSILFISSCNRGFSPMYYYNKNGTISGSETDTTQEPDIDFGEDEILPEEEDPFKTGEWNNPNYRFQMNFDDYVMVASFNKNTQPTYKLVKKNAWISSNPAMNEYYYNGDNTTGGGVTMTGVKYYLYKSKNPNFPGSKYNESSRMKRFYFYRFTASAAGQKTDNYLIAIDTYSKLVFAFGVPTSWKSIAGIPAPTAWGSVELGWEADAYNNSKVNFAVDGLQYFYEYDPVGIVKSNGEIEIYQWCWDSIGKKRYAPQFDGKFGDTNRAIATYNKPGRSPYIPTTKEVDNSPVRKMNITVSEVAIKNINAQTANRYALAGAVGFYWNQGDIQDVYKYAHLAYRFKIAGHTGMPVINTIIDEIPSADPVLGYLFNSTANRNDAKYKINIGATKTIKVNKTYTIEYRDSDDIFIDLYFDLVKYDQPVGNLTQMEWGYEYVMGNKIYLRLKFDKNRRRFVYDSYSDGYGNRVKNYRYDVITENQEKEVFITIDGNDGDNTHVQIKKWGLIPYNVGACGNGATGYNNNVELKFKIKFNDLGVVQTQ